MTRTTYRPQVLFLLSFLLVHGVLADQITLKNGDRLTGAIVKKDGKTLTVKTDSLGLVTLPWDYCQAKVPMGVVEAVKGNIKAMLRRGRGYKNLRYLLLKAQRAAVTKNEFVVLRKAA